MSTTIVVTSRNDGYGGNLEFRAQNALNTMTKHYDEVVYVDWCSPGESLIRSLNLIPRHNLRHIIVTHEDLQALGCAHLSALPIVEVLGRNIGVRRASGHYIASSNIDIMPSALEWDISEDTLHTVRRRNVPSDFFLRYTNDDLFHACYESKEGFELAPIRDDGISLIACCGDFQVAHRQLWYKMRGFEEAMVYRDAADSNLMKKGLIYGSATSVLDMVIFHLDHSGHGEGSGGVSVKNDWDTYITNFVETQNPDNWGFADYDFKEEEI